MRRPNFETQLDIGRGLEGESNKEVFLAIQELLARLEAENPQIVGIAPYGSMIRGASVDGSDVDIVILLDQDESSLNVDAITNRAVAVWEQIVQGSSITPELAPDIQNINTQKLEAKLSGGFDPAFPAMFLTMAGNKIRPYREYWADKFKQMPSDQQELLIDRTVKNLVHNYDLNSEKLPKKAGLSPDDLRQIVDSRTILWKNRVENILKPS